MIMFNSDRVHPDSMHDERSRTELTDCVAENRRSRNFGGDTITAYDTLQRLDYNSRVSFNALWEPIETVSIDVKPLDRVKYLKDESLEDAIKTRPEVCMTPAISLDKIKNLKTRKLLTDFTYKTTSARANNEVWENFRPQSRCLTNTIDPSYRDCTYFVPSKLKDIAMKWDTLQERGFTKSDLESATCNIISTDKREDAQESPEREHIKSLIEGQELNVAYDKLPLSYGGYRPHVALGIPLERRKFPYTHPNATVSQVVYTRKFV